MSDRAQENAGTPQTADGLWVTIVLVPPFVVGTALAVVLWEGPLVVTAGAFPLIAVVGVLWYVILEHTTRFGKMVIENA